TTGAVRAGSPGRWPGPSQPEVSPNKCPLWGLLVRLISSLKEEQTLYKVYPQFLFEIKFIRL
ncbi:hypothetical protein ACFWDG_20495, partial [Peribacillus sp. NPDC060186]